MAGRLISGAPDHSGAAASVSTATSPRNLTPPVSFVRLIRSSALYSTKSRRAERPRLESGQPAKTVIGEECQLGDRIRERAGWIARNVLPHEPAIRAWLKRNRVYDLDVDDIVQEMYAKIVSLETFENIRDPKRYAFQVANSVVVDHVRHARIVSIFSVGNVEELGLATPEADPEEKAAFDDEIREIAGAIAALPARTREVLLLRRVAGLSQRETASRLAIAEKTVEKHMARGVLMLMNQFGRGGKTPVRTSKGVGRVLYRGTKRDSDASE